MSTTKNNFPELDAPSRALSPLTKTFTFTTGNIARVLIASYFIGLGMQLFQGPPISALFRSIGLDGAAPLAAGIVVVGLASLIFLDIAKKPAGIALAALVALSSFIVLETAAQTHEIGTFWRDIAMICLLFFALRDASGGDAGSKTAALQAGAADLASPTPPTDFPVDPSGRPRHPRRVRTEIYRQDFDAVRVP